MKSVLLIFGLSISVISYSQENWEIMADSVVSIAKEQLGVTYRYATSKPNVSFDCSGFTSYVYRSCELPHSRSSKLYKGLGEKVDLSECRKGDCILFTGTDPSIRTIGHVGIILENTEEGIKFIHCSSSRKHYGVTITDYYDSGYPKRFMEVRRLIE